jgi:hypothetical protein
MYFTCPVIKHVLEPPLAGLASLAQGWGGVIVGSRNTLYKKNLLFVLMY